MPSEPTPEMRAKKRAAAYFACYTGDLVYGDQSERIRCLETMHDVLVGIFQEYEAARQSAGEGEV